MYMGVIFLKFYNIIVRPKFLASPVFLRWFVTSLTSYEFVLHSQHYFFYIITDKNIIKTGEQ